MTEYQKNSTTMRQQHKHKTSLPTTLLPHTHTIIHIASFSHKQTIPIAIISTFAGLMNFTIIVTFVLCATLRCLLSTAAFCRFWHQLTFLKKQQGLLLFIHPFAANREKIVIEGGKLKAAALPLVRTFSCLLSTTTMMLLFSSRAKFQASVCHPYFLLLVANPTVRPSTDFSQH